MNCRISCLLGVFFLLSLYTGAQQIAIPRIESMPAMPQPYMMRDWDAVALGYDSLVFDLAAAGQYLPLTTILENSTNYPEHPYFGIQSYVGTNSPPGRESINVIAAVVSGTLAGIDKSNQFGYNWPLLCEEYFNRKPSENVYLNGPNSSSGHDWWYDTMPNIFFYQVNDSYPHTGDFDYQFSTLADRWLQATQAMGGFDAPWTVPYMNYRAFRLSDMSPLESGIKQPEAAGAMGWLLYQAYVTTGEEKYRKGAEWCLEFLSSWDENPSYELQLPYGTYVAARMNAELGTAYDLEKMVNWCFDVGPLRGWGAILGTWNGIDVHGLIGESRDGFPDYAFNMNGFEQAGALVPMVRYDDRYARAIGRWMLNLANASRLFYSAYLPEDMQDNYDWTSQHDLGSVIAYEGLKERAEGPLGSGDAMDGGWAQTNLGLYGSSHVGILGALIDTTAVPYILQLDLLATDYYGPEAFPTNLFYNPYQEARTIEMTLPEGMHDIYDAVSNQVVQTNVSGTAILTLPADGTVMAVIIPASSSIVQDLNQALVQGIVIDYNAGVIVNNYPPRIKSLAIADSVAIINSLLPVYCTAVDKESGGLGYEWYVDGSPVSGTDILEWQAPAIPGYYEVRCVVSDDGELEDEETITIKVVEEINYAPVIHSITADPRDIEIGQASTLKCQASDENGDLLSYEWTAEAGIITGTDSMAVYTAPASRGHYYLVCAVSDDQGGTTRDSLLVLVYDPEHGQSGELIANYLFDGSAWDYSGYNHHGSVDDAVFVDDMFGKPQHALAFNSNSEVLVSNTEDLNFQDGITLSFWMNIGELYDREAYPLSHGNWQNRWKMSIGSERLRLTLNGEQGIIDLDTETTLVTGRWYHVVGLYNGWDCQLYLDGRLDALRYFEGKINTTTYDLIMGQSLPGQSFNGFKGTLDRLKIYNYGVSSEMVKEIYEEELSEITEPGSEGLRMKIYPNPTWGKAHISVLSEPLGHVHIELNSMTGARLMTGDYKADAEGRVESTWNLDGLQPGVYLVIIHASEEVIIHKLILAQ